jgi:hypothetical protein
MPVYLVLNYQTEHGIITPLSGTGKNFLIAAITALIGYVVFEYLRKKL